MRAAYRAVVVSLALAAVVVVLGASVLALASPATGRLPTSGAPVAPQAESAAGAGAVTAPGVSSDPSPAPASPCSDSLGSDENASGQGGAVPTAVGSGPSTGAGSASDGGAPNPSVPPAGAIMAAAIAHGACERELFPPRAPATAAQIDAARSVGLARPLYASSPAPIGLVDYGLAASPNGTLVASPLETTRLLGVVDVNRTGIQPMDLVNAEPDAYSIQLNAVLTGVTLFGVHGYTFWTQNVVEFFPAAQALFLVTNVWNFSGEPTLGDALYEHGPYGQIYDDAVYVAELPYTGIESPFALSLYLNSTVLGGRDAVDFTVVLSGPGESIDAPFDYIVFNSIRPGGRAVTSPAQYLASGAAYNPAGVNYDFELDLGGPGGGSQATLMSADAELGLAYWLPSAEHGLGGFVAVPSAFNYGGDTGETASGGTLTWSSASGGPHGLGTYGTLATGPATLSGLWNATGPEGSVPVSLDVSPSSAFEILTPEPSQGQLLPIASIGPTVTTDMFWLAPGNYSLQTALSGYTPATTILDVTGPVTVSVDLSPDASIGIYTPLWAWSNETLASIAVGGEGTPSDPYDLPTAAGESTLLEPVFGVFNDYGYAPYPGLFLLDTNASVVIEDPPPFTVISNVRAANGSFAFESLPLWFWNATGVALVDSSYLGPPVGVAAAAAFTTVFYDSKDDLIAGNAFNAFGSGALLLDQGPLGGPYSAAGGGSTVWGNSFSASYGIGLAELESGDLIYNNNFSQGLLAQGTTACQPGNPALPDDCWPVYSLAPVSFNDSWNVSRMPASVVRLAPGYPAYALTGSIAGTSWQGGNVWENYGEAANPYGRIPYNNTVDGAPQIDPGGDYEPLLNYSLYSVTFQASGSPAGAVWGAEVGLVIAPGAFNGVLVFDNFTTSAPSVSVLLPNLTGAFVRPYSPVGFLPTVSPIGLDVQGANTTVILTFVVGNFTITFAEGGLPATLLARDGWRVDFGGVLKSSFAPTIAFSSPGGTFPLLVEGPSGWQELFPSESAYLPYANVTVDIPLFHLFSTNLFAVAHGLPTGEPWCVELLDEELCSSEHTIEFANLTPGLWPLTIVSPLAGQSITASSFPGEPNATSVVVLIGAFEFHETFGFVYGYPVRFAETGLGSGTRWCVTADGTTGCSASSAVTLSLPNGTYRYSVPAVPGYVYLGGNPREARVSGGPRSVTIPFERDHPTPILYAPQERPQGAGSRRSEVAAP